MEHNRINPHKGKSTSFEKEMSELIHEQILFTESIYARLPIGVEVYDADGVLRSINDHALRMYGVDDRKTVVNKVNLFNSPYVDEALEAKIKSGDDITLEFEYDFDRINQITYYKSKNSNTMIYEVKVVAIWNKEGAIIGHMLLTNDVTKVKEAEYRTDESKKNLEMAMDAANMSSWVYDVQKDVFSTLYGETISQNDMTMEVVMQFLHPQDSPLVRQIFSQLINKEIKDGQITFRFYNEKEQQYRYYESRMRLSSEHRGKLLIVGTEIDVTEKFQMAKKTQDLLAKRELAMKVSNIVHWDFDVRTQKFESYNDPVNEYESSRLLSVSEYMNVIHPEDSAASYKAMQSMLEGKDSKINFTCRIRTKYDEAWQYCDIIGVPFEWDENGNIIRFTGFRQNIPKLQKLNRELKDRSNKLELSFKTVGISYWDYDVKTNLFRAFNDPVNDYLSEKEFTSDEFLKVSHPADVDLVREKFNHMVKGIERDFNFKYHSKTKWDNEWQILQVTGIPVESDKNGRCIRYTGLTINITKRGKMIQELKELKEKAELSDKLKSAFLANMSHEIRTPLNAIVGFSELLLSCEDELEREQYVKIIQSNNELLLRLVNDILDLSKIESGVLERKKEKFDVTDIANELFTIFQSKIKNPDVEFYLENPFKECWVVLDKNRLKQVWTNFLTNAVKFTKSGYIKMGYATEKEGIRIYVEDSGIGIPEELHDKVFARFEKINDFVQGTGLGLAISKAITETAGGEIGFSSSADHGSTFWAWFPCQAESNQ